MDPRTALCRSQAPPRDPRRRRPPAETGYAPQAPPRSVHRHCGRHLSFQVEF